MSWWRPSYAWAACKGRYQAEDDVETLVAAAENSDIVCINALLDKYPAVVVLYDRPDKVYAVRRDSAEEVHICYGELCIVVSIIETQPGEEEEKIAKEEAARERYAVLRVYALKSAEVVKTANPPL